MTLTNDVNDQQLLPINQLGDNDAITLEVSAFEGEREGEGAVIHPVSQQTQAALVTGGLRPALFQNRNRPVNTEQLISDDLESQNTLVEQGTVVSLSIQGQGGAVPIIPDSVLGTVGIVGLVGLRLALPGHTNQQIPLPEHNAGMLGCLIDNILGPNQSNIIWRLILIAAFNFVAAAMVGVLFLPTNLEGVHTTYWRVMLIMTVGVPIVVAVITLLVSFFWLASDTNRWSNWITGLSVANVSMLAGPLVVYWVLTRTTGN